MAQSTTPASSSAPASPFTAFMNTHHFLLRRLHSLTGLVPIGVFLIAHLVTNSSIVWGGLALRGEPGHGHGGVTYFNKEVTWINTQIPHLLLIEIALWGSIAFHSILGVYYARTGKANVDRYAYQDNWRYTLQRISGYVGILYIFYHIATLRWGWTWLVPGGAKWSHDYASSTMAAALQGSSEGYTFMGLLVSIFYLGGVSLLVFHFANGLWTAAITWGVTISRKAQQRWGLACAGLGAVLMLAGWSAVLGFMFLDQAEARAIEMKMKAEKNTPALTIGAEGPVDPAANR
jgi:succinate dehydrogenase / fumarate reductase, cytochrome b subunit